MFFFIFTVGLGKLGHFKPASTVITPGQSIHNRKMLHFVSVAASLMLQEYLQIQHLQKYVFEIGNVLVARRVALFHIFSSQSAMLNWQQFNLLWKKALVEAILV